ncbi:PadR family transcriptional regulator [Thermoactinospora rubra]|uniref:PadR family transcriptional regulator n=1 Tax=Thermoactinospora rubra TaxID=1088767 RepID=UPI000A0F5439|nr:PadR family transcriptional regulator [Thermoactinospora rubra]
MTDKAIAARQAQWLRGVLDLAVLALLEKEEGYGYTLLRRLSDAGLPDMKAGTLYPLLNRLAADGLLHAEWRAGEGGPGRKVFTITDAGRALLAAQGPQWVRFARSATSIIEGSEPA